MIQEERIESIIAMFTEDETAYVDALSQIMDEQPALLAFLSQESNEVLMEEEKDMLWYITLIIITSAQKEDYVVGELSDVSLSQQEEANWQIFHEQGKGSFRDRVTVFFEGYEEEDLLAFVEDSLEMDDDSPITTVGRDVIFITARTIIDTILNMQS